MIRRAICGCTAICSTIIAIRSKPTPATFHGLTAGVNLAYVTGAPTTRLFSTTAFGLQGRYGFRGIDPGADPNDIRKWTELRSSDVLDLSVRAQYDTYELCANT